jgi:hypothetical protein
MPSDGMLSRASRGRPSLARIRDVSSGVGGTNGCGAGPGAAVDAVELAAGVLDSAGAGASAAVEIEQPASTSSVSAAAVARPRSRPAPIPNETTPPGGRPASIRGPVTVSTAPADTSIR